LTTYLPGVMYTVRTNTATVPAVKAGFWEIIIASFLLIRHELQRRREELQGTHSYTEEVHLMNLTERTRTA
jgi:spermidine synthase